MKRAFESETPYNFALNLNYVPYRQKDQFLSPQFSVTSKRSSFSFRSPATKNKNKFSLKEAKTLTPVYPEQIQNQEVESIQCQINREDIQQKREESECSQEHQNVGTPESHQECKEESACLTTDMHQEQKNTEIFNEAHQNMGYQHDRPSQPPQQQNSQSPQKQTTIIIAKDQSEKDGNETPSKIKSIMKDPNDWKPAEESTVVKKVKFMSPPKEKQTSPNSDTEAEKSPKQIEKSDRRYQKMLEGLKMKKKGPFQRAAKQAKEGPGSSRLLMRFKKK